MKISELVALLEQRMRELGDLEVLTYEGGAYGPVKFMLKRCKRKERLMKHMNLR